VFDVRDIALHAQWCVHATVEKFACTDVGMGRPGPAYGIVLDRNGEGYYCTEMVFNCPIVAGVTATGIWLKHASNCVFLGGSAEYCGRGVDVGEISDHNTFTGLWFEGNKISDIDVWGRGNLFNSVYAGTSPNKDAPQIPQYPNVNVIKGQGTTFMGGYLRHVSLQGSSSHTVLYGTQVHKDSGMTPVGSHLAHGVMLVDGDGKVTGWR
jgi:hypothetical protein